LHPVDSPASLKVISRTCAWWTLGAGAVIVVVRFVVYRHRWFIFTGAALLHVALHGLFGMSYLAAGAIAAFLAVAAVTVSLVGARETRANLGAAQ
jgi:hypothetical protein